MYTHSLCTVRLVTYTESANYSINKESSRSIREEFTKAAEIESSIQKKVLNESWIIHMELLLRNFINFCNLMYY